MAEGNAKFKRRIAKGQGCPRAHAGHRRKSRPTRAIAHADMIRSDENLQAE